MVMNVKEEKHEWFKGYFSSLRWVKNARHFDAKEKSNKVRSVFSKASFKKTQSALCFKFKDAKHITSKKKLKKIMKELGF